VKVCSETLEFRRNLLALLSWHIHTRLLMILIA